MASLIAHLVRFFLQYRRHWFDSWVREVPWRRDRLPTPVFLGFPCGSASKESTCNVGDLGSIPGLGRSPGEVKGYPLQYSALENSELYSPRNSPGQNTEVGSLSLLQGIFPTQGSNPGLLHCRQILYRGSYKGSPRNWQIPG